MHGFTISVAEVLGRPGAYRDLHLDGPLADVETALARLSADRIRADLRLESVVEGILVTGSAHGPADLRCARCLRDLAGEVHAEVCELFYGPGHDTAVEEDAYRVKGTEIDLEPPLHDAVTLALPLNPLCREDCKGICARCGQDLNSGACACEDTETDPRWAALDALRDRLS